MDFHLQCADNDKPGIPISPELDITAAFEELKRMQERAELTEYPRRRRAVPEEIIFEEDNVSEQTAEESFFGGDDPFTEDIAPEKKS